MNFQGREGQGGSNDSTQPRRIAVNGDHIGTRVTSRVILELPMVIPIFS